MTGPTIREILDLVEKAGSVTIRVMKRDSPHPTEQVKGVMIRMTVEGSDIMYSHDIFWMVREGPYFAEQVLDKALYDTVKKAWLEEHLK